MTKLTFLLFLSSNLLLAAQLIDENTSTLDIVTEAKLPDGTIYQTFKVRGGSRFNTGKYGMIPTNLSRDRSPVMASIKQARIHVLPLFG